MRVRISVFTEEEKKPVHEKTMKILSEAGIWFKASVPGRTRVWQIFECFSGNWYTKKRKCWYFIFLTNIV